MATQNPSKQKSIAQNISNFDDKRWKTIAPEVMHGCLSAKFTQNPELKHFLLNTGEKLLIESSPRDLYWGSGLSLSNKTCLDAKRHSGENMLGKILMTVRSQLKECEEILIPPNIVTSPMH
jgi:hypothetical protein